MSENVFQMLKQAWSVARTEDSNVFGVEIAIVTNVKDPDQQGRVKICFPRLPGKPESDWARVAQPSAGDGRGFYWLPQVNDEVLVAFERGQANKPYVIGSLWNGKDKPMKDGYTDENTKVMVQSTSGHQIILEDKNGEETIIIADKSGKRAVTFNCKDKKFLIEAKEGDVEFHAKKKIVLQCEDIEIKTKKTGKVDIGDKFELKVAQKLAMKAGPQFNIKADKVNLNPPSLDWAALVAAALAKAAAAAAAAAGANQQQQQQAAAAAAAAANAATSAAQGSAVVPTRNVAPQSAAAAPAGAAAQQPTGAAAPAGTAWTQAPAGGGAGGAAQAGAAQQGAQGQSAAQQQSQTAATQPGAPQPSLSSDAKSPQPAGAAFNLKWTIANWAQGMAASIACDQDIGDGNGTNPQDVTGSMSGDGSGTIAVNPPSGGFKTGTFNYTLSVTPQGGSAVTSSVAVTVQAAAAGAPQPSLSTDAQNPQPTGAAFNLKWTIANWASGMTASIACDKDLGDGKGTDPQDVTSSVQSDGSGSLAVNPPQGGAFKDGTFKYKLTVTPQGSDPVTAELAVTVGGAAQQASASLAADENDPAILKWKASGASVKATAQPASTASVLEGKTDANGRLRLHVDPAQLTGVPALLHMRDESGEEIASWEIELAAPPGDGGGDGGSQDPDAVDPATLLGSGLDLTSKLTDGHGEGRLVLSPKPTQSLEVTLTADPGGVIAKATVAAMNFDVLLSMPGEGGPAPANMTCVLDLNPPPPEPAQDEPLAQPPEIPPAQIPEHPEFCCSFGFSDDDEPAA